MQILTREQLRHMTSEQIMQAYHTGLLDYMTKYGEAPDDETARAMEVVESMERAFGHEGMRSMDIADKIHETKRALSPMDELTEKAEALVDSMEAAFGVPHIRPVIDKKMAWGGRVVRRVVIGVEPAPPPDLDEKIAETKRAIS